MDGIILRSFFAIVRRPSKALDIIADSETIPIGSNNHLQFKYNHA